MTTQAFLYIWRNLLTGKWYIGSRTRKGCHPNDGYLCTSKHVRPMIRENPTEWVRTVLCIGHPKDMRKLEADYLTLLDAKHDPMSYNQHNGDGKFCTIGIPSWNKGLSQPTGIPSWNKGLNKTNNASMARASAAKMGHIAHNKGVPMSDKQKAKISVSSIGKPSPKKGKPGRPHTADELVRMSAKLKGRPQSPEHISARADARRGKKNPNPSPLKGVPKPKLVTRIFDRKEMTISNYMQWAQITKGA